MVSRQREESLAEKPARAAAGTGTYLAYKRLLSPCPAREGLILIA